MNKYDELVADFIRRRDRLRSEADEIDLVIANIIRLQAEGGEPQLKPELHKLRSPADTVFDLPHPKPTAAREYPLTEHMSVLITADMAGGREHLRALVERQKQDKALRPKSYYLNEVMKVPGVSGGKRDLMDQRVTNSIQALRAAGDLIGYKTGTTNQSMVWGPPDAFIGENPLPSWTINQSKMTTA